jgi:hypothetical protein
MSWKSTAVAGLATVTATWLASYAPVGRVPQAPSQTPSVEHTEIAAAEIQREADRLHARLLQVGAYRDPARNPFRYAPRAAARTAPPARIEPVITSEAMADTARPVEPTPRFTLTGIAEDIVNETPVRTAIISTPSDVFLVKVGEMVLDQYKVERISADGVELVRVDTGATVRLMLKP